MNQKVYYLCDRNDEPPAELVFPSELPHGYYSPGLFTIKGNGADLHNKYSFSARKADQPFEVELVLQSSKIFLAEIEQVGTFTFEAHRLHDGKYVGKSKEFADSELWILECLDEKRLDTACRESNFYFIGCSEQVV